MNDKNSDELYRLAESENGGKDTEMFGEFLERKAVVTVADLTKKRRRKAYETGADEIR